ncbi:MAG: AsmA-like C-terminal region-containing protein [Betaproteobacteria bacterium]
MDLKTIFTKTAKGVTQVNQKTQSLSRDLMKVLKAIDGKSNVTALSGKADYPVPALEKALTALQKEGFIKVFEVKQEVPLTDFGGDDDDFDFTAPKKMPPKPVVDFNATQGFKPSQYRTPASSDQVERASAPAQSFTPAPPQVDPALEAALAAAREKAQTEARAKAERESQIRARLEIEARSKREAEQRAMEEAKRAQIAAEKARLDLEAKMAAEKKQKDSISDTRDRLTREQIEKESQHQRALSEARAKAEAEAHALAQARVKAEAEAKALAEARMQAEAAAKKQQEEVDAAQRELRHQLKEEIEAKIRAEMAEKLSVDLEEGSRAEVEAAVMEEAREEARQMLEVRLQEERVSLTRATEDAKRTAEEAAKSMLAEQEKRIRAEMEAQIAAITAEKTKVEVEARKAAEEQAALAAKAAAEMAVRLKAEEDARRAAEEEAETRKKVEAQNRLRMEARAREEAEARAKSDAEMQARLAAEKEAKVQAQARAMIEAEMREKSDRENQIKFESERQAREEAEQKVATEVKAREIASRAAAEQAEARQRVERDAQLRLAEERREADARLADERREADERLNVERAAREKAEEKSRAEEEAEARQRAAQVARLKELAEQHEYEVSQGIDPDAAKKAKRYTKKKSGSPLRWLLVGTALLAILAVGAVHFVPLGAVNSRFDKALATWIHDDVSSSGLRIALLPSPHVNLDQLALGKVLDAKATSGKISMDVSTLFGDKFVIDTLELSGVTIGPEALSRALKWADPEGRGTGIEIGKIALRSAKIEVKGVAISDFDADIRFDKAGKIIKASARARDGKWTLDMSPNKAVSGDAPAASGEWVVEFTGRNLNLPMGAPLPFSSITAKGVMSGESMTFPQVDAKLFEGSATGNLRVDWKQGPTFSTEFTAEKIKVDQLTDVFTRDVALNGRLEGQFTASGGALTIAELFDKLTVQGVFVVKDGSIGNVDLVQVMRSPGSVGGQSKFAELNGQLRIADGVIHYDKLKLTGGVLLANGNVNVVNSNSTLSGSVNAEIRSSVAQDRGTFNVTGKVARPALKRGG